MAIERDQIVHMFIEAYLNSSDLRSMLAHNMTVEERRDPGKRVAKEAFDFAEAMCEDSDRRSKP